MNNRPYRGLIIWHYLRGHPNASTRSMEDSLQIKKSNLKKILYALRRQHSAIASGPDKRRVWNATEIRPRDGRGLSPASNANLALSSKRIANNWAAANAAKAKKAAAGLLKYKARARPREQSFGAGECALDQAWGKPISIPVLHNGCAIVQNLSREGAPEDNAQEAA